MTDSLDALAVEADLDKLFLEAVSNGRVSDPDPSDEGKRGVSGGVRSQS